jgi:hypothetical protein
MELATISHNNSIFASNYYFYNEISKFNSGIFLLLSIEYFPNLLICLVIYGDNEDRMSSFISYPSEKRFCKMTDM